MRFSVCVCIYIALKLVYTQGGYGEEGQGEYEEYGQEQPQQQASYPQSRRSSARASMAKAPPQFPGSVMAPQLSQYQQPMSQMMLPFPPKKQGFFAKRRQKRRARRAAKLSKLIS